MAAFRLLQVGCDQMGSNSGSLALLAELVTHGEGSEAWLRYEPTPLPRRDGRFQIGWVPAVSVSVAQPDAQIVQIPRPTGGIRWGSLDCLPEGSEGRFQVGQVSPANVSVAQPITQII